MLIKRVFVLFGACTCVIVQTALHMIKICIRHTSDITLSLLLIVANINYTSRFKIYEQPYHLAYFSFS